MRGIGITYQGPICNAYNNAPARQLISTREGGGFLSERATHHIHVLAHL